MIRLDLPFFPPSVNNVYIQRGHHRVLKPEGKKFKNEVKNYIGKHHPEFLSFFNKEDRFEILYVLYFEAVFNKPGAQSRYKKIDATNRVKLLEDILVDAAGYDDAQHFVVSVYKTVAEKETSERITIFAWNLEKERGPVTGCIQ